MLFSLKLCVKIHVLIKLQFISQDVLSLYLIGYSNWTPGSLFKCNMISLIIIVGWRVIISYFIVTQNNMEYFILSSNALIKEDLHLGVSNVFSWPKQKDKQKLMFLLHINCLPDRLLSFQVQQIDRGVEVVEETIKGRCWKWDNVYVVWTVSQMR